jgi:hypothetical protein
MRNGAGAEPIEQPDPVAAGIRGEEAPRPRTSCRTHLRGLREHRQGCEHAVVGGGRAEELDDAGEHGGLSTVQRKERAVIGCLRPIQAGNPARSGPFLGTPWLLIGEPEPPVLRATLVACKGAAGHTYRRLGERSPRPSPSLSVISRSACPIIAVPGTGHLGELQRPLGMISIDRRRLQRLAGANRDYARSGITSVNYQLSLDHADLAMLVSMGPSARHITPQALAARIRSLPSPFTVTVDLHIRVLQRRRDLAWVTATLGKQ